jgi:hypothetical protein
MKIMDSMAFASGNAALNRGDAARFLGFSVSKLDKLRVSGGGPHYLKMGRRVAYDLGDLIAWREVHKVGSTAEYPPPRQ